VLDKLDHGLREHVQHDPHLERIRHALYMLNTSAIRVNEYTARHVSMMPCRRARHQPVSSEAIKVLP
jgi:hypothetical protein